MKSLSKACALFMIMLALTACSQKSNSSVVLKQLDGTTSTLSKYSGKWVVINYWASWCRPCYKEVPELNAFYKKHQRNVVVFGVNYDKVPADKIAELVKSMGIEFPTLLGNPVLSLGVKKITGLPATYIISPQGKLVKTLMGPQSVVQLEEAVQLTADV